MNDDKWVAAAAVVEAFTRDAHIPRGRASDDPWDRPDAGIWKTVGELRQLAGLGNDIQLPDPFDTATLRAAAGRRGLIHARKNGASWEFTGRTAHARAEAEMRLTDNERALRTLAWVKAQYERNRARNGDSITLWPAGTKDGSCPADGIQAAVDAGLIIAVPRNSWDREKFYVPADAHDAYSTALADQTARSERARARVRGLAARITEFAGPAGGADVITLTVDQVEQLLARLNPTSVGVES